MNTVLKEKILNLLNEKRFNHKGLSKLASIVATNLREDTSKVFDELKELVNDGEIYEYSKNKFATISFLGFEKGKLSINSNNFGFVLNSNGDIYVSKKNLQGAFDGDIVLVKIISGEYAGKKREGKILKILSRENDGLVGTYRKIKDYGYVLLDKKNLEIRIPAGEDLGAVDNDKVVVDIISYKSGNAIGRVVEVIGPLSKKGNDIKWLLRLNKVRDVFSDEVLRCANSIKQEINKNEFKNRRDLTSQMLFTIDGKDAKDLDDAVSLEKLSDGSFLLGVHIADVGEYVKVNSPLDEEAFNRGTSIYFLNQVIPMLPKQLSNGICSLNPNVDRLALSVEIKISKDGDILDSQIFESVIRSKYRLNYDEVLDLINGDLKTCERLKEIKDVLLDMYELSLILNKRRESYGALDFDLPEGVVIVDDNNMPISVEKRVATKSTKIIETFMVMANEVVAKTFDEKGIPFIYRVHEKPDMDKMKSFYNFINTLGISFDLKSKDVEPKDLQQILNSIKGKDIESVVNMVMLRSLKKAKYFEKCLGHFGMALKYYCHFTSPIRRYPDLTIHRIIKEYLKNNSSYLNSQNLSEFVVKSSQKSSIQEKLAEDVERAITDYKKCEYMEQFIGNKFIGIISGVNARGFYVELDNTCEGQVSVASLTDDFYNFDEESLSLVSHNNFYKIGEKVEVLLVDCDKKERKLNFEVVRKVKSKGRK